jgi:hypothetical protein
MKGEIVMRKYFHILLVSLISAFAVSCAHNSAKEGILEKRAGYGTEPQELNIPKKVTRTKGKVKKAWLHAHEMPTGDYFGGAWVYLLVEETQWTFPDGKSRR